MKLNEKIMECRKKMGISQEELAHRVGVSRQAVSKWELGDAVPEVEKLIALAQIFQVTTDEVLGLAKPEKAVSPEREAAQQAFEQGARGQSELPGALRMFGRVIRRWGHVAGYIIALRGLGVTAVGVLARWMFGRMASLTVNTGMSSIVVSQQGFPADVAEELFASPEFPMSGFSQTATAMTDIPVMLANFIIVIGVLTIAGGLVLSRYLKKHRSEG